MPTMPDPETTTGVATPGLNPADETVLRESLKRCSPAALDAALTYRRTGGVAAIPAGVLGIISLVQKRGGRGIAIASLVIGGINLLLILGLFGLSLE